MESLRQHYLKVNREKDPPRYIVDQPGDLLHVPIERLDDCLAELKDALVTVNGLREQGAMGGKAAIVTMKRFTWIDDGKADKTLNVGL